MISRLMLNLRDPEVTGPAYGVSWPLSHTDIMFATSPAAATHSDGTKTVSTMV